MRTRWYRIFPEVRRTLRYIRAYPSLTFFVAGWDRLNVTALVESQTAPKGPPGTDQPVLLPCTHGGETGALGHGTVAFGNGPSHLLNTSSNRRYGRPRYSCKHRIAIITRSAYPPSPF